MTRKRTRRTRPQPTYYPDQPDAKALKAHLLAADKMTDAQLEQWIRSRYRRNRRF